MTSAADSVIHLTINGKQISVEPGTTLLEAARRNAIKIPTLCHHPQLRPDGACRLCLVEVEGMRALQTSCTLPVAEGMSVQTQTPEIQELRREILSLTLSEHPYTCLVCNRHSQCGEWQTTIRKAGVTTGCENCPKNGQCELQELVEQVGLNTMPYPIAYRNLPVEKSDPFFDRDYNLCVLCGRCVRMCQEVRLTNTLGFLRRGTVSRVGAAPGFTHVELDCEFCGACVDVCPTGALFDKRTKWEGPFESTAHTICPYCSVGCRLELRLKRGRIIGVRPDPEGPANRGQACVRGRFGLVELAHAENRLVAPLLRREGQLIETSWETALGYAAEKLSAYSGESFALIGSPHLTTEAAYLAQKFSREAMRNGIVGSSLMPAGHSRADETRRLILDLPRSPLDAIHQAGVILVIGANPRQSHPVAAVRIRQAIHQKAAKLIVLDPRETELTRRSDLWLSPEPGADAALIKKLTLKKPPTEKIGAAIRLLRDHPPAVILFGAGVIDHPEAPETIAAIRKLANSLGPQTAILPLLGPANTLGALSMGMGLGAESDWPGIAAGIEAGKIKALYAVGELPQAACLSKLELLISQDIVTSPLLENQADIVFPAAGFAEISGSMTNLEGREQMFAPAIPPAGVSRPDWMIFAQLAQRMGIRGFDFGEIASVRAEMQSGNAHLLAPVRAGKSRKPRSITRRPVGQEFILITERNAFAYRGFALTSGIRGMSQVKSDEGLLYIHPADAAMLGVANGDRIRTLSADGADIFPVRVRPQEKPGIVFISINPLTGSALFPAMIPPAKRISVRLEKVSNDGAGD